MQPPLRTVAAAVLLFGPVTFAAPADKTVDPSVLAWDTAFHDTSGNTPLHFTAHYFDGHGERHQLEEWRLGDSHLRRKTDNRIDLHADAAGKVAPGQALAYTWQILDLQKHIAHRVSTAGMLHLGMLYSYYSMAHLLTRPAGRFTVQSSSAPTPGEQPGKTPAPLARAFHPACTWWQIDSPGQASTRVCWVAQYGIPSETWSQSNFGWRPAFLVDSLETASIAPRTFATDTRGFQVRDVDEIQSED